MILLLIAAGLLMGGAGSDAYGHTLIVTTTSSFGDGVTLSAGILAGETEGGGVA